MPLSRTASALQAIRRYSPKSVVAKGFKPAAVLVPIQEIAGEHYLTLIERAATLHSHGGEIAFPGGNVTARILKQLLEVAYGFRANGKLI